MREAEDTPTSCQIALGKGDYYVAESGQGFLIYGKILEDLGDDGRLYVQAFSVVVPEGEYGYEWPIKMIPLTPEEFAWSETWGWDDPSVVVPAFHRMVATDRVAESKN